MGVVNEGHELPQVGALSGEVNPITDSDRVKSPVVGAGFTDFGGSHIHYRDDKPLAPTAAQKTNEDTKTGVEYEIEDQGKVQDGETPPFKLLKEKIVALVAFILDKKNIHTELKTMVKATSRALKDFTKTIAGTQSNTRSSKDRESQTSPSFVQRQMEQTPNKRQRTSPLQDTMIRKKTKRTTTTQTLPPTLARETPWWLRHGRRRGRRRIKRKSMGTMVP